MAQVARFESLNKENYDTWKMFMEALLVKNDLWQYVSGSSVKPERIAGNAASENTARMWEQNDAKARSDIVLSISSTELKQIKGCTTSRKVWLKLKDTYQSKGPARKAALLRQLTTLKMSGNGDIRAHLNQFFDVVDKINEIGVKIDADLLSTLLLLNLPNEFENFRCAIEARDMLPTLDTLRIKITEKVDARRGIAGSHSSNAMYAKKHHKKQQKRHKDASENPSSGTFKYKCHKCKTVGHKASDCKAQKKDSQTAQNATDTTMLTSKAFLAGTTETGKWCLDSGATSHFSYEACKFGVNMNTKREKLNLANKNSTQITGEGTARLNTNIHGELRSIHLENTQLVPDLRMNLLSVAKITDHGYDVVFNKQKGLVIDQDGNVKLIANRTNDLYIVEESVNEIAVAEETGTGRTTQSKANWHRRFGYLNARDLQAAIRKGRVEGIEPGNFISNNCDICPEGKMARSPFPIKSERSTEILDLVHTDLCGPMKVISIGGAKYILQFIDDSSRWGQVYFLKSKSDVSQALQNFVIMMENQTGRKIKIIQSDNGKEFVNATIDEFLKKRGIIRRLTVPYCPQQNGVAERRNRTLVEMARCLLLQSGLPPSFWAEAVNTANYIRNRCPSKSLDGRTPFEALSEKIPDVSHFREFGQRVFVLRNKPGIGKLDSRGITGIFVKYSDSSKGYRIWIPDEMKIIVSRDVKFLHTESPKENTYEDFYPRSVENSEEVDINKNHDHDMIDVILEPSENHQNEAIEENIAEVPAERIELANGDAVEEFQENQDDPPHDAQEVIRRHQGGLRLRGLEKGEDLVKNSTIIKPKLQKDNQHIYQKFQ
ncbi:retrovirus-related pol polyprotein from transposon tnt 1-94 [Lasius niger]|uniref:Retrovirus-related pol polyprotein from transposon tnt 1-94 n=1 Tax=Lasius niger TaxID=67767 RepID=A0A0J7KC47_LASNI|nr:retrovirus-related pol polyprotein from transposon tnt 1-94 [Lasius niger]